jgi:hypothetical protein
VFLRCTGTLAAQQPDCRAQAFPADRQRLFPLPPAPGRRADKPSDGDYSTESVESARQCEGEWYALPMAEMRTAPPTTTTANPKMTRSFLTTMLPRFDPRDLRLLESTVRSVFGM